MANGTICPRCRRPYNGRHCFKCGFQFTENDTEEAQNINETQQEAPSVTKEPEQPASKNSNKQEKVMAASNAAINNASDMPPAPNPAGQQTTKKITPAQAPNALLKAKVITQSNHYQKKDSAVEAENNTQGDISAKRTNGNSVAAPQPTSPAQQTKPAKPEPIQPQIKQQTDVSMPKEAQENSAAARPPKTTPALKQPTQPLSPAQTSLPQQTTQNATGNLQAALAARNPYSSIAAPPPVKRPAASGVTGIKKAPGMAKPAPAVQSTSNESEKTPHQDKLPVQPLPQQMPSENADTNQNIPDKQVIRPEQQTPPAAPEDEPYKKDAVSTEVPKAKSVANDSVKDSPTNKNEDGHDNSSSPEAALPSDDWRNTSLSGATDDTDDEEYEEDDNSAEESAPAENDKPPVSKEQKEEDELFDSMFHPKSDKVERESSKKKKKFNPFKKKNKNEPKSEEEATASKTESETDNDNSYNPNHDNYYDDVLPDIYSEEDKITAASIMKVVGFVLGIIFFIIAMIFYV